MSLRKKSMDYSIDNEDSDLAEIKRAMHEPKKLKETLREMYNAKSIR